MRRFLVTGLTLLLALAGLVSLAPRAVAAQAGWSAFTFNTSSKTGTMQQRPTGFPRAEIVTNSLGGGIGAQSGVSTYLGAQTPPGQKYGSSSGNGYLNLRPAGRAAAQASQTTYTFERPTPAAGWTFVLGDIDADQVTITATDAEGAPVEVANLGYRGTFNYCGGSVCAQNGDRPSWNAATGVLTGNTRATDTNGASAWFEPRAALSTLTFSYALRSGSPVYQTWFSALEFNVTGTVTGPGNSAANLDLVLLDPAGNEVATTTTEADGSYSFPGVATYTDYQLALAVPDGYTLVDGQASIRTVDLSSANAVEDFDLRAVTGRVVSGVVALLNGDPVAGVIVTLTGNGQTLTAVTDAEGRYIIDGVPAGTGYTLTASDIPDGTTVTAPFTVDVPANTDPPDQNFVVTPLPRGSLRGQVTFDGSGNPVAGALIVVSGPGGERDVRADEDGNWVLDDLEAGTYTVTVRPEGGNTVVGSATRTSTITNAGESRTGLDFELAPPPVERQTASGRVTDEDGRPVAGATVTATDPYDGEEFTATTDEDGTWSIDGLYPDVGWTATIDPPDGYEPVGFDTVTFSLLDDATGVDFVLARVATPEPTDEPTATPVSDDGGLADTGGPALPIAISGLLLIGAAVTLLRARRP